MHTIFSVRTWNVNVRFHIHRGGRLQLALHRGGRLLLLAHGKVALILELTALLQIVNLTALSRAIPIFIVCLPFVARFTRISDTRLPVVTTEVPIGICALLLSAMDGF